MFFEHIMQAGDRVVYNADSERRAWGGAHHPDGSQGTIIRRNRVERWYGRSGISCYSVSQPGLYAYDAGAVVKWDDSDVTTNESYDIDPVDVVIYEERYKRLWVDDARDIKVKKDELDNKVFIRPLPYTTFWEGDTVWSNTFSCNAIIREIDYTSSDAGDARYFIDLEAGGSSYGRDYDLTFVSRGNIWKFYHKQQLVFDTIKDEVAFWCSLYKYDEVRNPALGYFKWSIDEATTAIANGLGDAIKMDHDFFGMTPSISVIKLHDSQVGARLRAEFIKGFNLHAQ